MSETLLHFGGLKLGEETWFKNRRGASVQIHSGDWLRLDLSKHPEVQPAIQAGTATIEESAPPDQDVLDETSCANRAANPYGKVFSRSIPTRQRSRARPQVFELSIDDLEQVARCFLPWPGWQQDLAGRFGFSENRPHDRGAKPSVALPLIFDRNFVVLHRIAELIVRRQRRDLRAARNRKIEAGWASGVYPSKAACRKAYERVQQLPSGKRLLTEILCRWEVWTRYNAPSSRTLLRYRALFGTDFPVRAYVDDQILELARKPCQRIILGPASIQVGSYVPGRAASPALRAIGPALGCVVLDCTTTHEDAVPLPSATSAQP